MSSASLIHIVFFGQKNIVAPLFGQTIIFSPFANLCNQILITKFTMYCTHNLFRWAGPFQTKNVHLLLERQNDIF